MTEYRAGVLVADDKASLREMTAMVLEDMRLGVVTGPRVASVALSCFASKLNISHWPLSMS